MSSAELNFLIVDSDDSARAALRNYLEALEYLKIQEASRLKEALNVFNTQPIDCIVCAESLPGANGSAFLKLIRLQDRFKGTVFILTGTRAEPAWPNPLLKADGYLLKPFDREQIQAVLAHALPLRGGAAT